MQTHATCRVSLNITGYNLPVPASHRLSPLRRLVQGSSALYYPAPGVRWCTPCRPPTPRGTWEGGPGRGSHCQSSASRSQKSRRDAKRKVEGQGGGNIYHTHGPESLHGERVAPARRSAALGRDGGASLLAVSLTETAPIPADPRSNAHHNRMYGPQHVGWYVRRHK